MTNEEIKTHINERIEALKVELESKYIRLTKEPDFEDWAWYSTGNGYGYGLFSKKGSFNKGLVNGVWYDNIGMINVSDWQKVTDFTELEELLKKEAVNKCMVDGVKIYFKIGFPCKIKYPLAFRHGLLLDVNSSILMSSLGNWAELVKEKTTEEWIEVLVKGVHGNIVDPHLLELYMECANKNNLEITQKK